MVDFIKIDCSHTIALLLCFIAVLYLSIICVEGKRVEEGEHTRLCRWMVYSRATTSAIAERVVVGFLVADLVLGGMIVAAKGRLG